jgi:probable rRNA maturation factor
VKIFLSSQPADRPAEKTWRPLIKKTVNTLAKLKELPFGRQISITLADETVIRTINRDYRGVDRPTDVISFALAEGEDPCGGPAENLLGEIVICLPQALRQAAEYGHSPEREVSYLTTHGMFHLLGYDHTTAQDAQIMRKEEEAVMSALNLKR